MILQKTQGTKLYICPIKRFSDVVCVLLKDILESCILLSGISEPRFYGDLVYKFRRIVGNLILVIVSKRLSNVLKGWI